VREGSRDPRVPLYVRGMSFDQKFPKLLQELHEIEFDYADGDGIDFEPYQEFQPADENASFIQAWTGNKTLDGAEYRIFGQDGTGGYAGFWLVRDGADLLEQPIVFFGSEGEVGVVAKNFADYLWLLAAGVGPMEAVDERMADRAATPELADFAKTHAAGAKKSPQDVLAAAKKEFPDFEKNIRALCAYK
jgi:hypothetical protein